MQQGCKKVYISTSDVQMHANYHRKDSAIIQEGFQRFRATRIVGQQPALSTASELHIFTVAGTSVLSLSRTRPIWVWIVFNINTIYEL